ncbi:MAG: ornithine cyclodeaminase family protein [Chloroflexi bacterium]|nr:ornithine cyclodeaminase family protein [Chloroflexota bacterium]
MINETQTEAAKPLISRDRQLLYLSQADVIQVGLTMAEVIELVETAFREKGAGRYEMPPKPGIHPGGGDNFIHAMPAYIPAMQSAGLKWVSGYPGNSRRGLPYITGLLILNDPDTGLPLAIMDCVWITAMRTAAATAVAARRLARTESSRLGVLGCGVQGQTNTEALNVLFPLKQVFAYDTRPEAAESFAADISSRFGLEAIPVQTPREAVAGCDLVVTAGPIVKKPHATIAAGWLEEGAFASLVDFDSYWHPAALKEAAKFCTDDVPQFNHYREIGYFQDVPPIYADLGELVAGIKPGRENPTERTIACNLGVALDDMAVAPAIYRRAIAQNIGRHLPL